MSQEQLQSDEAYDTLKCFYQTPKKKHIVLASTELIGGGSNANQGRVSTTSSQLIVRPETLKSN